MGEDEQEGERLGSGVRVRINVRFLVRFTEWIASQLELGSRFNVTIRLRFRFRLMVRCV